MTSANNSPDTQAKLEQLKAVLREMQTVLVCFSGGVDSAFLLAVAAQTLNERAVALTAHSPSLPDRELDATRQFAKQLAVRHEVISSGEVNNEAYAKNPHNRCYFCKSELLTIAQRVRSEQRLDWIVIGTNCDDLGGHRPGLRAANEQGARHPLVEVGLTKKEIRDLSRQLKLPTWDKPEMACLASRFPYGTRITPQRLQQVEDLEMALRDLGFGQLRVRFHNSVARIEIAESELSRAIAAPLRQKIIAAGRAAGFAHVTVDLAGYRRGSLNSMLAGDRAAPDTQQVALATTKR